MTLHELTGHEVTKDRKAHEMIFVSSWPAQATG